jgi:hypothetical protein
VPSASEHRARADRNIRFAESFDLKTTPYLDWVVTAYFYASLHLVDALLSEKDGIDPPNHAERRVYVREKSYLRAISGEYRSLKDHSEDARYWLITMTSVKVEKTIIPLYKTIENHILPQLNAPKAGLR